MKPNKDKWLKLYKAWTEYGHSIPWDDLIDMKVGNHGYVALAWNCGDGMIDYADLSKCDDVWDMQNDGHDPIPLATWKKMKVAPECDWLIGSNGERL